MSCLCVWSMSSTTPAGHLPTYFYFSRVKHQMSVERASVSVDEVRCVIAAYLSVGGAVGIAEVAVVFPALLWGCWASPPPTANMTKTRLIIHPSLSFSFSFSSPSMSTLIQPWCKPLPTTHPNHPLLTRPQIHRIVCFLRGPVGGRRNPRLCQPRVRPSQHHRSHCQGPEREQWPVPQDHHLSQ